MERRTAHALEDDYTFRTKYISPLNGLDFYSVIVQVRVLGIWGATQCEYLLRCLRYGVAIVP